MSILMSILCIISGMLVGESFIIIPIRQIYIHQRIWGKGFRYRSIDYESLPDNTKKLYKRLIQRDLISAAVESILGMLLTVLVSVLTYTEVKKIIFSEAFFVAAGVTMVIRFIELTSKLYIINTLSDILVFEAKVHYLKGKFTEKGLGKHGLNNIFKVVDKELKSVRETSNRIHTKKEYDNSRTVKSSLEQIGVEIIKLESRLAGLDNAGM